MITCPECNGRKGARHIVNPDNGYLDTQMHNLREEWFACEKCKGIGEIEEEQK